MNSILIADMCYHQVMAESIYYPLKSISKCHLLLNEANFIIANDIESEDVTLLSYRSAKINWFKRRLLRLRFLLNIIVRQNNYSFIIITAGIEYVPKLLRFIWYLLICLTCVRKRNIIFVVHNVKYWERSTHSIIFGKLFQIILKNAYSFACLSEQVLGLWREASLSERPSFLLPFLTVSDTLIGSNPISEKNIIRIAVQGTVCQKRKRYDHLLYVISNMNKKALSRFQFVFQGPPVSKEDRELLKSMELRADIDWRDYYLSNEEMNELMVSCGLFLAPLNVEYGYGKFRESGIGFDCVKYQRAGIAQLCMCSSEFKNILIDYNNENDLLKIFESLNFNKLDEMYRKVTMLSKEYSHSYWAERLKLLLKS